MPLRPLTSTWWGPPRKFDTHFEDRRISWLELFFDLVYVIAISRITHRLGTHISTAGFLDYAILFTLVFWGWLNGSLYHDLHGNEGLRTRLMTLWQMMIIAALTITIDHHAGEITPDTLVVFMIMQIYITYQWWSVGIYDKDHRKYSKPYTTLYLISFGLLGLILILPSGYFKWILTLVIILNYLPPFITNRALHRSNLDLSLSSSMTERLGLFSIIVFGEVVLGVVNGIDNVKELNAHTWICFALALAIVFSLWWLFFTMTSSREAKKGFTNASLLELLYIPCLMSLGMIAVSFCGLFISDIHSDHMLCQSFGYGLTVYFTGIGLMIGLLKYPETIKPVLGQMRRSIFLTGLVFLILTILDPDLELIYYLVIVVVVLLLVIYYINALYYKQNLNIGEAANERES
jgi:low temperature requirement protein LtrA